MKKSFLCLILILSVTLCSCSNTKPENSDFTAFADQWFAALASSDSLTLNYTLANPESYGITDPPNGFQPFTYDDLTRQGAANENLLAALQDFDRDNLPADQQFLYDILEEQLITAIEGDAYTAFSEALGPTTGIQAQLPVLLAEFDIDDSFDLDQYFQILESLPDYFTSLLRLEEKKKELHTLPCRNTLKNIISQCRQFLDGDGCSLLREAFNARLSGCSFLSGEEKERVRDRHEACIQSHVLPSYQMLADGLARLLPFAGENGSLSSYPSGAEYYRYLVKSTTGSSLSIEQLEQLMTDKLASAERALAAYAAKDPSLFSSCTDYVVRFHSPEQILSHLKSSIQSDFPAPAGSACEVKYVDPSLEDFLSPAFYLTPPIDDNNNNVIYINNSACYDPASLFNTLAHEGYPGHLYQTCRMQDRPLHPLRFLLDYGGYTEGWGSYAEIYSYKYTGAKKDEIGILRNTMIATLCLYGLCDVGIHARGWEKEQLLTFLNKHGSYSEEAASRLYSAVIDEPASYLKYTAGYLEFVRLKAFFKEEAGKSYSEKKFHTFVIDMGPASFDLLRHYIPVWLKQNSCN